MPQSEASIPPRYHTSYEHPVAFAAAWVEGRNLNQTLTQQFDAWRQHWLQEHWRVVYLDGIHFSIRHGDQADSTLILTPWAWICRQQRGACPASLCGGK